MPNETNTEKIRKLELSWATHTERVDNLRGDLKRHEDLASDVRKQVQEAVRCLVVTEQRVNEVEIKLRIEIERLEKRQEETRSHHWEL